jgi:aminopeptidase YwaD
MKRTLLGLSLVLAALLQLGAQTATTPEAQRVLEHVRYLASPELAGRAPGTEGNKLAADYIEKQFRAAGLLPANQGQFQQAFTLTTGVKLGAQNSVMFDVLVERPGVPLDQTRPTKIGWKMGADYQPYGFSESRSVKGAMVFCGFGLSAPDKNYDDYAGIDVKDKIVIVLRGIPKWAEKEEGFKALASLRTKATTARDKGAAAIVFVNEKGDSADVLSPFGLDRMGKNSGIVALQVRRTPCARIFPPKDMPMFQAETAIEKDKRPHSYALTNTTGSITTSLEYTESTTHNVLGMVHGTERPDEYVVVGAHFDHLGMGDENSLHTSREAIIHPGADDNASGTAGVMELARRFASAPGKRTIVFMCFSGEEKGLLGSKHFTNNSPIALTNIVTMVNMDMIGRLKDNKLNVQGVGTSPGWPALLERAKGDLPFVMTTTADGFGPSDHSSFTAKNIPVLFFFTNLHSDYHRPTDTYDKINYDGEAMVLTMVERTVREVADAADRPVFTMPVQTAQKSASTGFRVTFGVIPDYGDDPQGLRITGVKAGGPAEKAGLKGDDIVTKFGATTIKNIYDLTSAMGEHKPGDKINVVVLRDGKELVLPVTLEGK